jgi:hypothetical protein
MNYIKMHLLYLNDDRTLHDCADMDEKNIYFSDTIQVMFLFNMSFYWNYSFQDYQSYRLTKRSLSTSSASSGSNDNSGFDTPNLQLTNSISPSNNSYALETKIIHIGQPTGLITYINH